MEQKTSSIIFFHLFVLFMVSKNFDTNMATAQKPPVNIKVGVVLDMNSYVGRMGLECISMALSDFYAAHVHYKTRLVLINRDSKGDIVGAAAAALDLLKNVQVQAIIGPIFSMQATFMIALADKAQVPVITFSATTPSLSSIQSPFYVRASVNDSSQVQAIGAIIQAYRWREVVLMYEDNMFGEGIIPFLTDALEQVNSRVRYRSVLHSQATDDQIDAEIYKLMTMQTRVFIVHMMSSLGSRMFMKAKELGLMTEDYIWIITDGLAHELSSMDASSIESMLGVIGVKPHVPNTKEISDFTIRYKKRIQQNNPKVLTPDLNIFGLWAYDSSIALAMAAEKAILRNPTFQETNISRNSTDLEAFGISNVGPSLINALLSTTFRGLAGNFILVDGQLQSPPYQIVNVVGRGDRVIGYWTKENGIVKELNSTNANTGKYSTSKSNFRSIIWPGDRTYPAKGWVIPTNGKKLRIGVPVKDGFFEFVNVTWNADNSTEVEGYCIDVFDEVIKRLPYGLPYEYIPYATSDHKMAGDYNDLAYQVYLGNYDAVVGDVTIVANRSQYVDFTLPYMESDITMVVPYKDDKTKNAWVFLKPLTVELWLASFCSFVFIGCLIWILEHRINEDFRGPPWYQLGMIFWFAFSTMVFAHKERVISNLARFVLIIWFLVVLILTQSYTASLTSTLTVQQLQPTVTDVNVLIENKEHIGYKNGSFVYGFLVKMKVEESKLVAFNSVEEMDELFLKGSGNGGIAAAFHEIPYIKLFLAKYCSKYTMVGRTYRADGFGFVFPIGSPLVPDVSRAILNVSEGETMMEIERKWFGDAKCPDYNTLLSQEESLGLASFWGLFLIVGIAGCIAFVIYAIKFLHENGHVMESSVPGSSLWSKMVELLHRFDSPDLNSHTFKAIKFRDRDHTCCRDCLVAAMNLAQVNNQQTPFSSASPNASQSFSSSSELNRVLEGDQGSPTGNVMSNPLTGITGDNAGTELATRDSNELSNTPSMQITD